VVAHRVLHIWSRLHCRWIAWRGTYAAWKLLPHAIVVGCAVTLVTVHVIHTTPPTVPSLPAVPPYVYLAGIPHGRSVPNTPDWGWMEYPDIGAPDRRCHKHCKPEKYTVPEPASWALMLAGLAMAGLAAKQRSAR
jgi:hypothetical protein